MKTFFYLGQCDKLRLIPGGEGEWQRMMNKALKVTMEEFIENCSYSSFDDEQTLEEFIADDPTTRFCKSTWDGVRVYFIQTSRFEFIFLKQVKSRRWRKIKESLQSPSVSQTPESVQ